MLHYAGPKSSEAQTIRDREFLHALQASHHSTKIWSNHVRLSNCDRGHDRVIPALPKFDDGLIAQILSTKKHSKNIQNAECHAECWHSWHSWHIILVKCCHSCCQMFRTRSPPSWRGRCLSPSSVLLNRQGPKVHTSAQICSQIAKFHTVSHVQNPISFNILLRPSWASDETIDASPASSRWKDSVSWNAKSISDSDTHFDTHLWTSADPETNRNVTCYWESSLFPRGSQ